MLLFDDEIKQLFLEKLQTLMTVGETISHHKTLESETVFRNADGEIVKTAKTVKTEKNVTLLPTPAYVMQMIDKNLSVEESLKNCQQAGYVVIDPTRIENEELENSNGLSEFAVSEISAKLLGLEM